MKPPSTNLGFTLIETVVSIGVFTIIAGGLIVLYANMFTTNSKLSILGASSDQGRKVMFQFMKEIRNAEYANTGAYPIASATSTEIIFYSNIDGGADIERVRYYLSNGKLYRGVVKPTGTPFSYNLGSETTAVVQSNVANGANPLFYYYDGSYTGSEAALTYPLNLNNVRIVTMDLRITNSAGQVGTNYFSLNASGVVRSLKSNLAD